MNSNHFEYGMNTSEMVNVLDAAPFNAPILISWSIGRELLSKMENSIQRLRFDFCWGTDVPFL